MGAAVIVLLAAGLTAYTLLSPALGVVLWTLGLLVGVAGIVRRVIRKQAA